MNSRLLASFVFFAGLVWIACASTPDPRGPIAQAELAIEQAEQARAAEHAPLEMRIARENYERARLERDDGDETDALRAAEKAEADALLAIAKARVARERATNEQLSDTVRAVEEEIDEVP